METNYTNSAGQLQSALPCISIETIEELISRDLLHFDSYTWRFGDDSNGTTRRLDGRKFGLKSGESVKAFADNKDAAWHRLLGLDDVVAHDREYVLLAIEGSKDALATADFAHCIGALSVTGITCALGSGYRPIPPDMHKLAGRWVGVIGDNDDAGHKTTAIVSDALGVAGVAHAVWDWSKCEIRAKDFFAFWAKAKESGEAKNAFVRDYSGTIFSPTPPSSNSAVLPFSCSTQVPNPDVEPLNDLTIYQFVAPYVVTKRGTSNSKSFDLARAVVTTYPDISMNETSNTFDHWFTKSRPCLPKDADRDEYYKTFLRQLKRVRFTDADLRLAMERARQQPFVAPLDGNEQASLLAALCRELQRNAGDRPFLCAVSVAQEFLQLRWPEQANWLLHQLERLGVLECVDRGAPNTKGKKGKSTLWHYKLPLDQ